jgi:CO/xanthine dehydrogenase Mo-binding subunit
VSLIGRSVPRSDGPAKVTGTAHYVDDIVRPGTLWGATLRSEIARGRLISITQDPSFDWNGVTVITAADVPVNVVALIEEDQPVLAEKEIRHAYEPLALVACEDPLRLARALAHLHIELEPLEPVLTIEDSLAARHVLFGTDNVFKRYRITKGDASKVLASSPVVITGRYSVHHQEQLYIEPQGVLAFWEGETARVVGSLQCPFYVHKGVKRTFDLPDAKVDVTQAVTGGGFGGKEEYPTILALHALLLARKAGRPVKMIYDRMEDIEATTKRHPATVEITSGCARDGTLRAARIRIVMDGGAYVTLTPVVLSRGALHAAGAYRWEAVDIEALAVATNTPPNGAMRGFGAPQTIWAMERHMDRIARELGLDPLGLRAKNALKVGDTTATGQLLSESVGVARCIEKAVEASGWARKRAAGPVVRGRKSRGIGASVFLHGAGFTGSGERRLKGRVAIDMFAEEGGEEGLRPRFRIRTASTDIGQGTETVFRQIAAEALWVSMDRVDFAVPSTAAVPDSGPTVASRTVMIVGSIVERAARELFTRIESERLARGGSFGEAALRILRREGPVTVETQYESPPSVRWDDDTYTGDAYPVFGWACDVAEVEVDLDTFETAVVGFWAAADVGKAIHPLMCKGQIEGGTLQAIGWALSEKVVFSEGKILNGRMTNYIVPTSLDAPRFTTILVEEPYSLGPGAGAKGLGELPMDGGAPAIAAAIEQATGLVMDDLPLLPEDLWEAEQARLAGRK